MSSSIGGISFWQQDVNYWNQAQAQNQSATAENTLINAMASAETTLSKGLSSIANGTALKRVNSQLVAAVQSALQPSGSSTSTGSAAASSASAGSSSSNAATSSGSSSSSAPTPATGTGTASLTTGASLSSLGILAGEEISISTGLGTTNYTSTGTDTVADLINAVNVDLPTNANVTAALNAKGELVFTSRNTKDIITIAGTGTAAAAIGFGTGNTVFSPTQPTASSSAASSAANASSSSGASSSSSSSNSSTSSSSTSQSSETVTPIGQALALQGLTSAASILSADGVSGTLVNMLA